MCNQRGSWKDVVLDFIKRPLMPLNLFLCKFVLRSEENQTQDSYSETHLFNFLIRDVHREGMI